MGRFSEERRVLGGLEVGLGSLGAPPATFKSGNPHFLPTLSFPALAHWGPGWGPLSAAAPRGPLARGGPEASAGDHSKAKVCPSAPTGKRRETQETEEAETERQRGRDRGRRERLRDRGDSEMEGAGE